MRLAPILGDYRDMIRCWLEQGSRVCANGHGGHAIDANYCRICGLPLELADFPQPRRRDTLRGPSDPQQKGPHHGC